MKKITITFLFASITLPLFGQINDEVKKTEDLLNKLEVKQFELYKRGIYFGDTLSTSGEFPKFNHSLKMIQKYRAPVIKDNQKDTATYYVDKGLSAYDRDEISDIVKSEDFGDTRYLGKIMPDGRIYIHTLFKYKFLKRNDTLFINSSYNSLSDDSLINLMGLIVFAESDEERERLNNIVNNNTSYYFRPLFTCKMFDNEHINHFFDQFDRKFTVTLLGYWNIDNRFYYKFNIRESKYDNRVPNEFVVDNEFNLIKIEEIPTDPIIKELIEDNNSMEEFECK
jgi:hypothetical protein